MSLDADTPELTEPTQPLPGRTGLTEDAPSPDSGLDLEQDAAKAKGWSTVEPLHRDIRQVGRPQIGVTPEGGVHVVWTAGGDLWHMFREGEAWSKPTRLVRGTLPSLVTDTQGYLHMVFAHDFAGNFEIYYMRWDGRYWTLPYNISRTPGMSHNPALVASQEGPIYVVWEDDTPGYPSIYHAYNPKGHWINAPVPGARGWRPALAFDGEDTLHLVWEDAMPHGVGDDIYHSQLTDRGWSLPENISDTPESDSSHPRIAGAHGQTVHVVWQERLASRTRVAYSYGHYASWLKPIALAQRGRNREPTVAVSPDGHVHVVWVADDVLVHRSRGPADDAVWRGMEALDRDPQGVGYPAIACDSEGGLHSVWRRAIGDTWALYYRHREPIVRRKTFIPKVIT